MSQLLKLLVVTLLLTAGSLAVRTRADAADKAAPVPLDTLRVSDKAPRVTNLSQLSRAQTYTISRTAKIDGVARGPETEAVYPQVAPRVVVVRTTLGHGTGFVVDPAGWIVTNHHVIANASADRQSGAQTASIHVGQLVHGIMRLVPGPLVGLVYKDNDDKDLALLKVQALPAGWKSLPALKIAPEPFKVGTTCLAIGHPASGIPWTIRKGEVTGIGNFPHDMLDNVITMLSATGEDRVQWEEAFARTEPRKIVLSDCGLSPGDSGGPLVNSKGELIAVSFAVPTQDVIGSAKLAYHVHSDELKKFLDGRPTEPLLHVADPWPIAEYREVLDLDKDGSPETIAFSLQREGRPTGLLIRLDQENQSQSSDAETARAISQHRWMFNFGMQWLPQFRTFYDTDNDGKVDLILTDNDQDDVADIVVRLTNNGWSRVATNGQKLVDPSLFKNRQIGQRFTAFGKLLNGLTDEVRHQQ